jgi:transcription elongation factor Elf1
MPLCEGCGSSYEDTFNFCPHCGRSKPEPETIKVAVEVSSKRSIYDCPLCGDAASVQKVSAIVDAGTSEGSGSASTSGSAQIYLTASGKHVGDSFATSTTNLSSVQQSKLAQKLAHPAPPRKPLYSGWNPGWVVYVIVGFLVLAVLVPISEEIGEGLLVEILINCGGGLILTIAGVLGLASLVNRLAKTDAKEALKNEKYQAELAVFNNAKAKWDDLFYCHKHDIVYLPGRKDHAPSAEVWKACGDWGK